MGFFQFILEGLMAAQAEIAPGSLGQLELGVAGTQRGLRHQDKECEKNQYQVRFQVHIVPLTARQGGRVHRIVPQRAHA